MGFKFKIIKMKELNDTQKEFLLENFFKDEKHPDWKNIATNLLEKGKCIVAGDKCIWFGGIGNFIKTSETEEAISCLLYTFDLKLFLSSQWFKQVKENYLLDLVEQEKKLNKQIKEIAHLF